LELFRQVLFAQSKIKPSISSSLPKLKGKAPQRLPQNKPLLTFHEIELDWTELQALFSQIAELAKQYLKPTTHEIKELDDIASKPAAFKEAVQDWFVKGTVPQKTKTKGGKVSAVTASVLQAALYPWLATYTNELLPLVDKDSWHQRFCPVCGGSSDFTYLEKEYGERWLVCSRCDAQWYFYRLACPYCGNQEHDKLAFFTDDKGLYRLYVCEKCRRYIKGVDLRKTEEEVLIPLERVYTLDMDRQAVEQNYKAED
jgi:FdhE protein